MGKFTEGYCIYEGTLVDNAIDIPSATACQVLCQINPLCNYFDYNKDEQNCQELSSPGRTCDLIRGPPTPTLDECSIDPTPSPHHQAALPIGFLRKDVSILPMKSEMKE